jgi:hypothetical protein
LVRVGDSERLGFIGEFPDWLRRRRSGRYGSN